MKRSTMTATKKPNRPTAPQVALADSIARLTGDLNQLTTAIPALTLHRWEHPTEPTSYMLEPSVCLIAQGVKRVLLAEEVYTYDVQHYLITSVGLPVVAQIIKATEKKPYLGLALELDRRMIAQLMVDSHVPRSHTPPSRRGMAVSQLSPSLLSAFQRLIDLLDHPEDIPILSPLIQQEIIYRLLVGDQGSRLRQIATVATQSHQVARAIDLLRDSYAERLRVDDLAEYAGMSVSNFHHHFRALTALSPLQFQKRLRLNEARRLMLTEHFDAASAAFQVGYESPSQFSREYSRLFGMPPARDIKSLMETGSREVT